jgi:hypothetical protein
MGLQVLVWVKGSDEPVLEYINFEEPEMNSQKLDKMNMYMQKYKSDF